MVATTMMKQPTVVAQTLEISAVVVPRPTPALLHLLDLVAAPRPTLPTAPSPLLLPFLLPQASPRLSRPSSSLKYRWGRRRLQTSLTRRSRRRLGSMGKDLMAIITQDKGTCTHNT